MITFLKLRHKAVTTVNFMSFQWRFTITFYRFSHYFGAFRAYIMSDLVKSNSHVGRAFTSFLVLLT